MKPQTEPVWMSRLEEAFWPIVYILMILTISVLAESHAKAQVVAVDEALLDSAAHELVLFDSLKIDYASKDSLISEFKALDITRLSDIGHLKLALKEKDLQTDLHRDLSIGYVNEIHIRTRQAKKYRNQRNVAVGAIIVYVGVKIIAFLSKP